MRFLNLQHKHQWVLLAAFFVLSVGITAWWLFFNGFESLHGYLLAINEQANSPSKKTLWLTGYAVLCVVSQLLIVPSGSLILMAAGFIFSPLLAATIFSIAQVLCSWPVYALGSIARKNSPDKFNQFVKKFKLPDDWDTLVQKEGFYATVVLRLTPVIPSAAACLIASALQLPLKSFIPATIAVCWIRPLFFASLGGSFQSLADVSGAISSNTLKPLFLVFLAATALLVLKVYIHYKSRNT